MEPMVTVIIPTKNEEKNIRRLLESVKNQSFSGHQIEVIVVDNFSSDKTKEIAKKYTSLVFECGSERSTQRNFGLKKAQGKYVLFLDADMELSRGAIEECIKKMKSNEHLIGLYIPEIIAGKSFWCRVRKLERSFYDATVIDGLRFIKTEAAKKIGGFDEKMFAAEDWDLDKRLKKMGGVDIIKSPLYHHEENFDFQKYLKKKAGYSTNFDVYIKKWGKDDPDIRKQFGLFYRYFGVFIENGKWKKIVAHPILSSGMLFLKILVGFNFLRTRRKMRQ